MAGTPTRARRFGLVIAVLVLAGLIACVAYLMRPRGNPPAFFQADVADPAAAKRAGDELIASRDTTVVVSVAHPDDAEWYAGGTAILLARSNKVILLMGTSGDKGAGGWPGVAAVRERLQLRAARIVGYDDVVFLRHPDQGLAQATGYRREVEGQLRRLGATIALTFDVGREAQGYRHADHEAAGRTTLAAARSLGGVTVYGFSSSAPDVIVDYAQVADRKRAAFAAVSDYRVANPFYRYLAAPLLRLRNGPPQPSFGMRAAFPGVGVEYGEVFRRIPASAR